MNVVWRFALCKLRRQRPSLKRPVRSGAPCAAFGQGRGMLDVDTYLKVRTAVQIEGVSNRATARRFGI